MSQQSQPRPGQVMPSGYGAYGAYTSSNADVGSGYPMYAGGSGGYKSDPAASASYDDFHEHGAFEDPQQQQGLLSGASAAGGRVGWAAHTPATAARERWMQRHEDHYANGGSGSGSGAGAFNEKASKPSRKWWWIGGGIVLLAIIIAGVAAGLVVKKNNSKDKATGVVTSDKNDPSNFTKDSRLHKSFYGMCYTPTDSQYPSCGASQDAIIEDIQLMSQLTPRLRLYGADCDVGNLVLTAIEKTKVDMSVYLALWVDDNDETWQRQVQTTKDVLTKHGVNHVAGVIVGNEYILNGGSVATLLSKVTEIKTWVTSQNYNKTVPVGTADAGSMITTEMANGADFLMENTHVSGKTASNISPQQQRKLTRPPTCSLSPTHLQPWFGGVPIDDAAGWTWDYANNNDPGVAVAAATTTPEVFIAEVGWPTGANDTASATLQAAVAGTTELQTFLDTYICQANTNITATNAGDVPSSKYFYFEYMDQVWKDKMYGGVEGHWGLFDSSKQLKQITIPDCASP